jgi:acyl-coenzyme A synthetase/AMP-(fatty) acid ligase
LIDKEEGLCQDNVSVYSWPTWLDIIPEKGNHLREKKITWRELHNRVNLFTKTLMSLEIKKRDYAIIFFHE